MQSPDIREVSLVTFPDPISQQGHMDREAPRELIANCRRKALPLEERVKIYEEGRSPLQITKEFDVGRTQVQRVLKVRESVLEDFEIAMHPCITVKQKTMEKLTFE
ncbi:UNVERIFIED_CONTAM: hypothetical protein FKN15_020911 [Acipenser sinensis]